MNTGNNCIGGNKQETRSLDMLGEVVDQCENPPSVLKSGENDELLCPKCRDLFKLSRYKVTNMEVSSWKLAHSSQGGGETPMVELMKDRESEADITLDQELQEDEEMEPQESGNTELVPSGNNSGDTELFPDQAQ